MNLEQKQILLEFFKLHPILMKTDDQLSTEESTLWSHLTLKLNCISGFVTKDWKEWRSIWINFYSRLTLDKGKDYEEIDQRFVELLAYNLRYDKPLTSDASENFNFIHKDHFLGPPHNNLDFTCNPCKENQFVDCDHKNMNLVNEISSCEKDPENIPINFISESTNKLPIIHNVQNANSLKEGVDRKPKVLFVVTNKHESASNVLPKIEVRKISTVDSETQNPYSNLVHNRTNLQSHVLSEPSRSNQKPTSTIRATALEKAIIKKITQADSIKLKYMRLKLKMENSYHKRKLGLMKQLLKAKLRKVKAEEKQATALLGIAESLDRMLQTRH